MIVFLCTRGSGLRSDPRLRTQPGIEVCDLEAPCEGGEVTVAIAADSSSADSNGARVVWQGRELTRASAVVVERPVFAWPQSLAPGRDDRAQRALLLSALRATALSVPVIDAPEAARWAALPTAALSELARAEIDVHPWTAAAFPAPEPAPVLAFDVAGAVLGYEPRAPHAPHAADVAWWPEPFEGAVDTVLVAGGRAVGGARWPSASAWQQASGERVLRADELASELTALALRAAQVLGVANLELDCASRAVLRARAGPDLDRWNQRLDGSVVAALLECATRARSRT